jgi:hypothetical protein
MDRAAAMGAARPTPLPVRRPITVRPSTDRAEDRVGPPGVARRRIAIISAGMGAGHDGAADGLQLCLETPGFAVDRHDFLDLIPAGLGGLLRGTYHRLLVSAPGGYQRIYAATEQTLRPAPAVRALLRSAERRTLRTVTADTAAVASTYPGASQALGALLDRLAATGVRHAYGRVAEMPDLMRACDVLVQNAGGLTSLEAFAVGLPVAGYRCIPGHGQTNAAAQHKAGLAVWIKEPSELAARLSDLLDGPLGAGQRALGLALFGTGRDPVSAVVHAAQHGAAVPAQQRRTAPARRPRTRRPSRLGLAATASAVAATLVLGIGAPIAEAYADSPRSFGAISHLIEGDRK